MSNIGKIEKREITREMEESYLDYAMSVIISRALPDVRDGLKPVHRRILYAMHQMGLNSKAKFRKSATVVGETMGKYHPHGDSALYDSLARMAQDFSMRYPLIDGQGNFGCFTKDTKVQLCDGRTLSFGALVKEQRQGKRHWTFSFNSITKKIEIAEIKNPRLTKRNADLVEVILDNGSKIKCTPSHLFMLRDGAYEEAQSLQLGRSLMPFYQKISGETDKLNRTGYVLVYQPKTNQWTPSHHLADNYNLFVGGYKKSKGRIRHHIDFDKTNNNPDNITRMHWGEHWRIHCEQAASQHQKADYREKIAAGRERFWSNPKNRARYSAQLSLRNKINWANPN